MSRYSKRNQSKKKRKRRIRHTKKRHARIHAPVSTFVKSPQPKDDYKIMINDEYKQSGNIIPGLRNFIKNM